MYTDGFSSLTRDELNLLLESRLDHHVCDVLPEQDDGYYPAAVMILLVRANSTWNILFTQRTENVRDHKGQVSFPGGAWEQEDLCLRDTALRETVEEIGIKPEDVQVIGSLSPEKTVTGYYIVPFIGLIEWPYPFKLQEQEVERVFVLPLDWLKDEANQEEREFTVPDRNIKRKAVFYKEKDGYLLWGITAMLTIRLLELIK